ncbi:MAG: DUF2799 domain-containing protein [Gammaproteobacteria bacterium]|nr:DUF2799 domain-containing protein [Gammaproteobacteria bacterium]
MTNYKFVILVIPLSFLKSNSSEASTSTKVKSRAMIQQKPVYRKTIIGWTTFVVTAMSVLLMFSGCVSLSKTQCLEGDWFEIGLHDGESGVESEQFNVYVDTCAKYNVVPDFAKYSEGRTKGLEFFCTHSNGYSEGRQGREYRNVCSGTAEELFLEGHSLGYNVHLTEEVVEDLNSKIREKVEQIEIWKRQIDDMWIRSRNGNPDMNAVSDRSSQRADLESNITDERTQIEELRVRRAEAMNEYQKAVDEANENGILEDAIVEYPDVRDEDGKEVIDR